jgi:hypothetical protein
VNIGERRSLSSPSVASARKGNETLLGCTIHLGSFFVIQPVRNVSTTVSFLLGRLTTTQSFYIIARDPTELVRFPSADFLGSSTYIGHHAFRYAYASPTGMVPNFLHS